MVKCDSCHMYCSESRKVLLGIFGGGLHGVAAWLPASRADLIRVLLHVLDGLQSALGLLHTSAKCQVVDGAVLDDALRKHTQGYALSAQHLKLLCMVLHEAGSDASIKWTQKVLIKLERTRLSRAVHFSVPPCQ